MDIRNGCPLKTDGVNTMSKSQTEATNVNALIRSRQKLIWIVTPEEVRVESYVFEAAIAAKYVPRSWDCGQGVTDVNGVEERIGSIDPGETLNAIRERGKAETGKERGVWIMRDLPPWLNNPAVGIPLVRALRNFARTIEDRDCAQTIVVMSPNADVPAELANHTTVINWPLPDREEIADIIDKLIEDYDLTDVVKNGQRDAAIDAAVGLTGEEAQACYSRSLVQLKTIDAATVAKEKKRVITREKILEWYDPIPGGLDAVGGLENLKTWLVGRAAAYTAKAREYGLPRPKGTMLVGISGCGKSLTAKSIATAWNCPLIRVDLGALKNELVGRSEANLRKAFAIIEALGFCVVWFDEVEKALQGATSGSADGGVSADAMGAVLTWMQERKSDAFVIMTANDVTSLPPEFLRKGRFDEVWWVDLPNKTERAEVMKASLRTHGRDKVKIDLAAVALATEGFTGSEIAAIVPDALFAAFADDGREITTKDLIDAAAKVVPLSKTAEEKITAMRKWANGRARFATKAEVIEAPRSKRAALDIA